jgi:chromosome partitioning protein
MKIITVGNTKGGVGKSTLATNLAVEASLDGKRVLLVDADIQQSSEGFLTERELDDISGITKLTPNLHKVLKEPDYNFDLIIIDAGGRDSFLFRSAIAAADFLLIPTTPSQFDIWSTKDTIAMLEEVRIAKPKLAARMVLNLTIPKTVISQDARKALMDYKDICPLTETTLYSRVAYKYSVVVGQGVSEYEPGGKAAQEIQSLYEELMTIIGD